ncbi:MAG: hypothetical protein ACMG50_10690 [Thermomonas sp.]
MNEPAVRERNWDAYAAVIASLIGLLALVVSGYTAYLQRQQVRAQVWPMLVIGNSNLQLKQLVMNQGLGPAKITGMKVTVDGKITRRWVDVMRAFEFTGKEGFAYSTFNGMVLAPGETADLFVAADSASSREMFNGFLDRSKHSFAMSICYCSVLDDCWLATDSAPRVIDRNVSITTCPILDSEQFQN